MKPNLLALSRWTVLLTILSFRVMADIPTDSQYMMGRGIHPIILAQADSATPPAPSLPATVAGPDFTADLASFTTDPTNLEAGFKLVVHAVQNGQWGLLVSLLLTFIVAMLRKFVPPETKVGAWLRSKLGGVVTTFTLTLGTAFAAQFLAGLPLGWALVLKAVSVALGASGGWAIFKNVKEAIDEQKAQKAGVAAATEPVKTLDK